MRRHSVARRNGRARGFSAGLLVGGGCFLCFACALADEGDTNFREDVLLCEEAVAHLQDCCPGLDVVPDACEHRQQGCSEGRSVLLRPPEARCIRARDCAEVVAEGICERAEAALVDDGSGELDGGAPVEVCQ